MTAQQQAFDAKVEQKINAMMPYLVKMSGGDPDLIQEASIGIWEAMSKAPDATDGYYRNKAKWTIIGNIRGVGRSVDIPKAYPRKTPITIVHHDAELSQAVLADWRRLSLDEWVIQKMDFRRFLDTLSTSEYGYVHLKTIEGMADAEVSKRMDISLEWVRAMKKAIRNKIEDFYTV